MHILWHVLRQTGYDVIHSFFKIELHLFWIFVFSFLFQLTHNVEILNDKSVCANADLKADMERWHKTKHRDLREIFIALADKQIERYEKVRGEG